MTGGDVIMRVTLWSQRIFHVE